MTSSPNKEHLLSSYTKIGDNASPSKLLSFFGANKVLPRKLSSPSHHELTADSPKNFFSRRKFSSGEKSKLNLPEVFEIREKPEEMPNQQDEKLIQASDKLEEIVNIFFLLVY